MKTFKTTHDVPLLKNNILFISIFILLYEQFCDTFVECVKKHLCAWSMDENCKDIYEETEDYKNKIVKRQFGRKPNILLATISWFLDENVIEKNDYNTFLQIRKKRGVYVHEMSNKLCKGISKPDFQLFAKLLLLYQKLNSWCDKNIDNLGDKVESISNGYRIFMALISSKDGNDFYGKEILKWCNEYMKPT